MLLDKEGYNKLISRDEVLSAVKNNDLCQGCDVLCNIVIIHTNDAVDLWRLMNKNIFVVTTSHGVASEAVDRGANVLMERSLAVALHRILSYRYNFGNIFSKKDK